MNSADATYQQVLPPASVTGNAAPQVIDTNGYEYLELVVELGAGPATTAMTVLKLQESDVEGSSTTLTNGTDVPGCIAGTSLTLAAPTSLYPETPTNPASALPANNNVLILFNVDLKGRKRFLLPIISTGAAQATLLSAIARLSRAEVAPHLPSQQVPTNGLVLGNPPPAYTSSGT
jgi:hypothetical protein